MLERNPRELEPFFSYWMNELTEGDLHEKGDIAMELAAMSKAIDGIAHWLSASLDAGDNMNCDEYIAACEQVFLADVGQYLEVSY